MATLLKRSKRKSTEESHRLSEAELRKTREVEEALEQQRIRAQHQQLTLSSSSAADPEIEKRDSARLPGFIFDINKDRYFRSSFQPPIVVMPNSTSSASRTRGCNNILQLIPQLTMKPVTSTTSRIYALILALHRQFEPLETISSHGLSSFDVHPSHGLVTTSYAGAVLQLDGETIWNDHSFQSSRVYRLVQWNPLVYKPLLATVTGDSILLVGSSSERISNTHVGRKMERRNKKNYIRSIKWTRNGNSILVGSDFGLFLTDCESGTGMTLWPSPSPITACCAQTHGSSSPFLSYCALRNGAIHIVDSRNQSAIKVGAMRRSVDCIYMMQNDRNLIAQDGNGFVQLFDLRVFGRGSPCSFDGLCETNGAIFKSRRFSVIDDENILITSSHLTTGISFWDLRTLCCVRSLPLRPCRDSVGASSALKGYVEFPMTTNFNFGEAASLPYILAHFESRDSTLADSVYDGLLFRPVF